MHNFQIGQLYNRSRDIHDRFGGSRQSGISPCKNFPFIFIFTGSSGGQYGYQDDWDDEGLYHYTGEGQIGDMTFTKGNKAIRDHQVDGRDILLFEQLGKGRPYRFLGEFACTSHEIKTIPDGEGTNRQGIIFHLLNIDEEWDEVKLTHTNQKAALGDLRTRAYQAATSAPRLISRKGKQNFYERHHDIKAYVLQRSNGICECCGAQAPFVKKDGAPYLEAHHILKLSDKGLDDPRKVAAITPNCHREIHYGVNGKELDQRLLNSIAKKEDELER